MCGLAKSSTVPAVDANIIETCSHDDLLWNKLPIPDLDHLHPV